MEAPADMEEELHVSVLVATWGNVSRSISVAQAMI